MNVFVVRRIEPIFDRALVVVVDVEGDQRGAPLVRTVFRYRHDGWPLIGGQVAEKGEDDAVLLLDRIGVDACARWRLSGLADRGNADAHAIAIESPAVIRTLDGAILFAFSAGEARTSVDAGIRQNSRFSLLVTEDDEVVTQQADLLRCLAEIFAANDGIPKIDVHASPPCERGSFTRLRSGKPSTPAPVCPTNGQAGCIRAACHWRAPKTRLQRTKRQALLGAQSRTVSVRGKRGR